MAQAPASKVVPAVAATAALAWGLDAWQRRKFGGPLPRTMARPWQVATTALWYSWPRVAADPIALNPIRRGAAPAGPGRVRERARLARHYIICTKASKRLPLSSSPSVQLQVAVSECPAEWFPREGPRTGPLRRSQTLGSFAVAEGGMEMRVNAHRDTVGASAVPCVRRLARRVMALTVQPPCVLPVHHKLAALCSSVASAAVWLTPYTHTPLAPPHGPSASDQAWLCALPERGPAGQRGALPSCMAAEQRP